MAFLQYMLEETERQSPKGKPIISITSAGALAFSKNLTQNANLMGKHIILYYDPDIRKIGIKFLSNKNEYSMEIKPSSNSSYVACSRFFRHFNITIPMIGHTFKQIVSPEQIRLGGPLIVLNYPDKGQS